MDQQHSQYARKQILQRVREIVESCTNPDPLEVQHQLAIKWYLYLFTMYSMLGMKSQSMTPEQMMTLILEAVRSHVKDGAIDREALIKDMADATFQMYFNAQSSRSGGPGLN
jgi:hypothetical protein